jgi:cell division protein FtsQ
MSPKRPARNRLRKDFGPPRPPVRERLRKTGRWMLPYALAVGISAALGGGAFFGWRFVTRSHRFAISDIQFRGIQHALPEDLERRLTLERGDNLFRADLRTSERELQNDPWIAAAKAHRELPRTVVFDVTERVPACAVLLDGFYLAEKNGHIFKRATTDELEGLLVVTGIDRDQASDDSATTEALVREALEAVAAWNARPALSEVNVHPALGVTLFLREGGAEVRLGRGDLPRKLARYDLVLRDLARRGEKPRAVILDSVTRPDRIAVRLQPAVEGG